MSAQLALFASRRERDRILGAMAANHRIYIETLRSFAREHALRNIERLVTIDDVRRLIQVRDFPFPSEIGADERIFGVVFRSKEFRAIGQRPTARADRIARSGKGASHITVYALEAP